ncbi:MAG: hypothetical protein EB127_24115 [Alphaproteobacteria bacterium]|nr:hypothetical protein [Alphaproteobacteria bacterium]
MSFPMNNEAIRALCIAEEERAYQSRVDSLTEQISRAVIAAAKEGKTRAQITTILTELPASMLIRQVRKRFPEALIGYELNEGEAKLLCVDWS